MHFAPSFNSISEATFNETREEIREEIAKLEKSAEKYEEDLNDIEANLDKIAEIAANAGVLLKSPIVEEKKAILKLLLSDCKIEEKNLCFSIVKPFDVLIKMAETEKWCATLSNYRTNESGGCIKLSRRFDIFNKIYFLYDILTKINGEILWKML